MTTFELKAIGVVESPLTEPRRPSSSRRTPPWLVFEPEVLEGLRSLRPGDVWSPGSIARVATSSACTREATPPGPKVFSPHARRMAWSLSREVRLRGDSRVSLGSTGDEIVLSQRRALTTSLLLR